MPTDPHRALVQKRELAIAVEALMREEAVVNHYAARGKNVISVDDNQTRAVLNMVGAEPAADILVELGPGQLVIAEVKGSDLDRALTQLQNTATKAAGRYQHIACKVFVRNQCRALTLLTFAEGDMASEPYGYFTAASPVNGSI